MIYTRSNKNCENSPQNQVFLKPLHLTEKLMDEFSFILSKLYLYV